MEPDAAPRAGDVVIGRHRHSLVILVVRDTAHLVEIVPVGVARHRAHVLPRHWSDLASSNLNRVDIAFACERVTQVRLASISRIGHVPAELLANAAAAVVREHAARVAEGFGGLGSNLVAMTVSAGRRHPVVRYA